MNEQSIVVPDVLGEEPDAVERFFAVIHSHSAAGPITLDLTSVTWIRPYGAISLLGVCRYLKQLTHQPVRLTGLQSHIHAYLRRIDFFKCGTETVYTTDPFNQADDLGRSTSSSNVLELFPISVYEDIYEVADRARRILAYWLGSSSQGIGHIVTLLSEASSNIVDHSGDTGVVTIQKYERKYHIEVTLAGEVSDTCAGYIVQALAGLSARSGERGGQGLGAIQRIATESGGSLYIRSEMGSVLAQASDTVMRDRLYFFPGTQVVITFRSKSAN
jgi:anti-sigma regulatory factor (Ser/Thr protein kinase)